MPDTPVLLTGGAGYIGSVLSRMLLAKGHRVRVLDSLKFGADSIKEIRHHKNFEFIQGDIRHAETLKSALEGVKQVIHLAAIVGDPACKKFAKEAVEVNTLASANLLELAIGCGVKKFIFASTCSNYGIMQPGELLDEDAPLNPQSEYAEQKTGFEKTLLASRQKNFRPIVLRFSTVYGVSPRMRFDLSLNHFTRDLWAGKTLEVMQKDSWRPYCHVRDLARSVVAVVQRKASDIPSFVYNVGATRENYTKEMLVNAILRELPQGKVKWMPGNSADPRDYRVNFSRIARELNFRLTRNADDGVREIIGLLQSSSISDPFDSRYCNA